MSSSDLTVPVSDGPSNKDFAKRMEAQDFHGLPLMIEYRKGDRKKDDHGNIWCVEADYGYIMNTTSPEEEELDVYLGPDLESEKVAIIALLNDDGTFNEHKVMLGFKTIEAAKNLFELQYWTSRTGPIMEMSLPDLKQAVGLQYLKSLKDKSAKVDRQPIFIADPDIGPSEEYKDPEPPLVLLDPAANI